MKIKILLLTLSVIGFSAAQADVYQCALKDNQNSGWIPDNVALDVDEKAKTVHVFDPITAATRNGAVAGKLLALNSIRIDASWESGRYNNAKAKATRDNPNGEAVKIRYRATLLRGQNKLLLKAAPRGSGQYSARGDCRLIDKLP